MELTRTVDPIAPTDEVAGRRVVWLDPPGTMRTEYVNMHGWRAGSNPRQARSLPGYSGGEPHSWFVALVEEDAYFRKLYGGEQLPDGAAIWVPLAEVFIDD